MPQVNSRYKGPPFYYINGHFETVIPSLRRKVEGVVYERQRIDTPDDDFLDIDWIKGDNEKLLIISHGLEGNSNRHYVKGLAKLFAHNGWDVVAWNNRTCNGEMNRQRILYHHAASYDLRAVVEHCVKEKDYKEVALAGISMGGGQTLRYLGEEPDFKIPEVVKKAVVISAPCALLESAETLSVRANRLYEMKFLVRLKDKIRLKAEQFPDIDISRLDAIKTLREFDELYSGPIHGFKGSDDFYQHCDPLPFIPQITREVLIINALNDPLLKGLCYPFELADKMSNLYLETPKRGGHVGFIQSNAEFAYSEVRALEFCQEY